MFKKEKKTELLEKNLENKRSVKWYIKQYWIANEQKRGQVWKINGWIRECYDSDMQPRKPVVKKISPHSAISAILTWAEEGMRTRMWSLLTALASEVTLSMIFIMLC